MNGEAESADFIAQDFPLILSSSFVDNSNLALHMLISDVGDIKIEGGENP